MLPLLHRPLRPLHVASSLLLLGAAACGETTPSQSPAPNDEPSHDAGVAQSAPPERSTEDAAAPPADARTCPTLDLSSVAPAPVTIFGDEPLPAIGGTLSPGTYDLTLVTVVVTKGEPPTLETQRKGRLRVSADEMTIAFDTKVTTVHYTVNGNALEVKPICTIANGAVTFADSAAPVVTQHFTALGRTISLDGPHRTTVESDSDGGTVVTAESFEYCRFQTP